ncbi:MAG: histidine phosphatase family protein [Ignavibacteriae bacterium]|nr:histidine phosphatase family protein [Ignavibacteriota bacterium]
MKTLILVRHAKSSWENAGLTDFDRPLNERGLKDAPQMAKLVKDKGVLPDLIISSPAVRAITTSRLFAKEFKYPLKSIQTNEIIYTTGPKEILNMLSMTDDSKNCVMLFGHNPDMTALANYLSDEDIDNLPTAAVLCIDFYIDSWALLTEETGKVRFYEYPKKNLKKN